MKIRRPIGRRSIGTMYSDAGCRRCRIRRRPCQEKIFENRIGLFSDNGREKPSPLGCPFRSDFSLAYRPGNGTILTMDKTKRSKPTTLQTSRKYLAEAWRGLFRYLPPVFSFRGLDSWDLGISQVDSGNRPRRREGRQAEAPDSSVAVGFPRRERTDANGRSSEKVIGLGEGSGARGILANIWLRETLSLSDVAQSSTDGCGCVRSWGLTVSPG